MTAKFKTVKEFLTWLVANTDYDEEYLYFVFKTDRIEISGADSLEEYQNGVVDWSHFINGQFSEDYNIGTLYLDEAWSVSVEIEAGFSIDAPYQLENDFKVIVKEEEPIMRVIIL